MPIIQNDMFWLSIHLALIITTVYVHISMHKIIPDYRWPCITTRTKSRIAQFCTMDKNVWSWSAWVIFRFWYILKEQSFYIILKFGSIKQIISSGFCYFSRSMCFGLKLVAIIACILSFPYNLGCVYHLSQVRNTFQYPLSKRVKTKERRF